MLGLFFLNQKSLLILKSLHSTSNSIKETGEPNPFDSNSASIIKLNNNTVLYLREVNAFLALVCILREENFDKQASLSADNPNDEQHDISFR